MKLAVIDTNILVSAFWSKDGAPAEIMGLVLNGLLTPCFDYRILEEYREVLLRDKFGFQSSQVKTLLDFLKSEGMSIIAPPLAIELPDVSDKKFLEVMECVSSDLITGNKKHFPASAHIFTPAEFLKKHT